MASYSDDFNRADGGLGANWTAQTATVFLIVSNDAVPFATANFTTAFWNANAFADDQFSEVVLGSVAAILLPGAIVRASGTGGTFNCYFGRVGVFGGNPVWDIGKFVAGSYTGIASGTPLSPIAGDVIRLEVSGTGLTLKLNGSTLGTGTDADLASGSAGIEGSDVGDHLAAWTGGDLGAAGNPWNAYAQMQ